MAEEHERLRRLAGDYQPQVPVYPPEAKPLTREEEKQDYLMAKNTQGEFDIRLEREKKRFGLVQAVEDILNWSIRNENA
jgi:hypothetical protein